VEIGALLLSRIQFAFAMAELLFIAAFAMM